MLTYFRLGVWIFVGESSRAQGQDESSLVQFRTASQVSSPNSDILDESDNKLSNREPKVTFYKQFKPMLKIY